MSSSSSSISSHDGEEENSLVGFTDPEEEKELDAFVSSSVSVSSETSEIETLPHLQCDDQSTMMPESSSAFAVHKDGSKVDDNSNDESPSDGEVSFRKFARQLVKNFLPSGSKKNLKEVQNEEQIVEESESDDYGHSPTFSELFALNTAKEGK